MEQPIEKVKSQMRKGILEYCILLILHQREAYSTDIINILKESQLMVVEGTLYPLLSRLKNTKLLSYSWVESTQGPPRKYYRITEKGEEFLVQLREAWDDISTTVQYLSGRTIATPPQPEYVTVTDPTEKPINNEADNTNKPF